jgi:hypothetical protein
VDLPDEVPRFKRWRPVVDIKSMLSRRRQPRMSPPGAEHAAEAEHLRARLTVFGDGLIRNPVKDPISALRVPRDEGRLSPSEYAAQVAGLLGTTDLGTIAGAGGS